jgi:sugar phosphate isomerase/epimerase
VSRREFLRNSAILAAAAAVAPATPFSSMAAALADCPIVVFSKLYQELKLSYADAAAVTAESGLDGVDSPVRPGGEVLPERVAEDLPRYAEELAKHRLKIHLLTTGITSAKTPHAENVLRAASKLGIRYYRLGFFKKQPDQPAEKQAQEIAAGLRDLAGLNKELGLFGLFQNHTGSFGADLSDTVAVGSALEPLQFGLAFDIGHALAIHGDDWRGYWDRIKPQLRIVYVKDAKKGGGWVPFGQGAIPESRYFPLLKQIGYSAPISLHIEFDWSDKGKNKTRERLVQTLRDNNAILKRWLKEA